MPLHQMSLPGASKRLPYKRGIDFDGSRKKRHNDGIELRKHRRLQGLQKRRAIFSTPTPFTAKATSIDQKEELSFSTHGASGDVQQQLPQFLLDSNVRVSESIVQLLTKSNFLNTSTSTHVNQNGLGMQTESVKDMVVSSGVVPLLVAHLQSKDEAVRQQSALCIGNVAGEMPDLRDFVIQCGAIQPILDNISQSPNDQLREKFVWSLSTLCRGKQTLEMNNIIPAFPTLIQLLNSSHCETLINACWAIAFLTEDNDTVVKSLIDQNLTPKFISFLCHRNSNIVLVALRILGNFIIAGEYIQQIIDSGILLHVSSLLNSTDSAVRSEICYLLSSIADHGTVYIDHLLNLSTEMEQVIDIVQNASLHERTEAIWIIFNIANKGTDMHLKKMVDFGALPSLCQNLALHDVNIILLILESIENILLVGERMALQYMVELEKCGGRQNLESLLSHKSDDVYHKANYVLEQFFEEECRDEYDENWYSVY